MEWSRLLIRFLISALVLYFIGYLVAGFSVLTIPAVLLLALAISFLAYVVELVITHPISNYTHAVISFIISFLTLVAARYIISGAAITIFGSLTVALIIGLVDLFVPEKEEKREKF
ncbi:MAG: phage holin family protein [Bacillota bacterium]